MLNYDMLLFLGFTRDDIEIAEFERRLWEDGKLEEFKKAFGIENIIVAHPEVNPEALKNLEKLGKMEIEI